MKRERFLLLALMLLGGCASDRYSLGSVTFPGNAAEVKVLGQRPKVAVENEGPGRLRVDFDSPDDAWDKSVTLGVGLASRRLPGPVRVRIEPIGSAHATWRLTAWRAGGLRADLVLEREESTSGKR